MIATLTPRVATYADLRNAARKPLADLLPLECPLALYIETISACNFKCGFCPVSRPDYAQTIGGTGTLPSDLIDALYGDLKYLGKLKVVRFYGGTGEPLLDKRLPDIVRRACLNELADRYEVTTNGSSLTRPLSRAIVESGLTHLRVSVYGWTEGEQAEVTGSRVSPLDVMANVKYLRGYRDEIGSVAPYILAQMVKPKDPAEARGVVERYAGVADEVYIEPRHDWDGSMRKDKQSGGVKRRVCPHPWLDLTVKADGTVVCCCVDWAKRTAVGNLNEESFVEIWRGERLREFRRMHLMGRRAENPACAGCTFLDRAPDNLDGVPVSDFERILT